MSHAIVLRLTRRRKPPGPAFWMALVFVVLSALGWIAGVIAIVRGLWMGYFILGFWSVLLACTWPAFAREWRAWRDGD
jgi:hypothetical protein